jgi:hypothetical protein
MLEVVLKCILPENVVEKRKKKTAMHLILQHVYVYGIWIYYSPPQCLLPHHRERQKSMQRSMTPSELQ